MALRRDAHSNGEDAQRVPRRAAVDEEHLKELQPRPLLRTGEVPPGENIYKKKLFFSEKFHVK